MVKTLPVFLQPADVSLFKLFIVESAVVVVVDTACCKLFATLLLLMFRGVVVAHTTKPFMVEDIIIELLVI